MSRIVCILSFLLLAPLDAVLADAPLRIFMLHSYSQEYPWSKSQHEGFLNRYQQSHSQPSLISSEYLDSKRRQYNSGYGREFFNYLQNRYRDYQPDLIYVTDDNALSFALEYFDRLFADVPIIFSGVNDLAIQQNLDPARVTGVFEKKNISANLQLLQQMDPDIERILVVGDGSETYQAIEKEIREQLQQHPGISARYLASQHMEELVRELHQASEKYLFLTTLGQISNAEGQVLPLQDIIADIVNANDFITLSMEDAYLFDGVLGGLVTSGRLQGQTAADMALLYLQGTDIADIPAVTDSPGEIILDYRELNRLSLQLPAQLLHTARILNQPASFYERNRTLVVWLIVVLLALFIFSLLYFLTLVSRKNIQIQTTAGIQKQLEARVSERTRELETEKYKLNQAQAITHIGNYSWEVDSDVTSWSEELYRIVDRDPQLFKPGYQSYVDCIHPDDRQGFIELTRNAVDSRHPYTAEYRILRPNGEVRFVHEQGEAKIGATGRLQSLVGVIQDITERKLYETRLKHERDFNDSVLEIAGNIIVILDMNGCFVRFNRAAEELTGYLSDEVLGKPLWDYVIPEDQMAGVKNVFHNLQQGKIDIAGHYENDWLLRDGSRRSLEWRNTVLRNKQGEVTHIVTLGYDMTERKAAAAEHDRLQRELNQARKMEALGQLTGGVAHDFNNMLGIIIGYTDLAIDQFGEQMDETLNTYCKNISTASHRARDLVKQMMVFSHSERTEKKPLSIQPLIEENVSMFRSVIPSSIKILVDCEDDLPLVRMDPVQLQQIMMNLCLNARDAMQGAGTLSIHLGWQRDINRECNACHKQIQGDWIELSVSDDGSGMDEQVVDRIFEPFFTTKEVGQGTGMGMSVLHAIMDSHQGHVFIDTEKNRGTSFRLLFPAMARQDKEPQLLNKEADPRAGRGKGERILVVDDEPALAEFMCDLLNNNGYDCCCMTHSPQALKHFQQHAGEFDLLITDQTMPDITGLDMIAEIRRIDPQIPVILTSGYSEAINHDSARQYDIHFMDKPVGAHELLERVEQILHTPETAQA
jgi:PAS domain S-box-containing protein